MAKKRRKPSTRTRTPAEARLSVRTADGPGTTESEPQLRTASTTPSRGRVPSPAAPPQRTRTEKKELARRQREEIRRRVQRAQRTRQLAWTVGIAGVIAVAVFLLTRPDEPATRPETLPGELTTDAPWPANGELAAERADAIGLPAEGTTMHEHADVQVFVSGEPVTVPVNIGIDEADGIVQALHSHSGDGVVHMESSVVREFTLGEFFDVWGVRLSGTCLGAYCEDADNTLRVFKDGVEVTGPIRDVVLDDLSVIVVTYGTQAEVPDPIPTFDFSSLQP